MRFILIGLALVLSLSRVHAGLVVAQGATWSYWKGTSTPANQGSLTWTTNGYDASSWSTGPSGFGFGDSDDATVLADMQTNYASVLIRRSFVIGDTGLVTHATLEVDYDDGFVAYVNGVEVGRRQMPAGAVTHSTTATNNHEASRAGAVEYIWHDPQEPDFVDIPTSLLRNGTNIIALSGHNISSSSSDFSLIPALYTNVTLLRGPFVQLPGTGRIAISWRTDALTDSVVDYGLDMTYSGGSVSDANAVRHHAVHLPPLLAGTTYFYRVKSGGIVLGSGSFRAPPSAGQPLRIAIVGDFGSATTNTAQVAAQVAAQNPDVILSVGDNIYQTGQPGSFDSDWFRPYSNAMSRAPMLTALGNHDVRAGNGSGKWAPEFLEMPTNGPASGLEKTFSFDIANAHIAVIDANSFDNDYIADSPGLRNDIKTWLTNDLAQTTQTWKLVVYHHPPYSSQGSHGGEAMVLSDLVPIFEQYGVDWAFQGHNHFYERLNPINGVNYLTSGGGGFSLHGLSFRQPYSASIFNTRYSFAVMDVNGSTGSVRGIDQNGLEVDQYTLDIGHPFLMDGLIDNRAWGRATNGLILYAAIKGRYLYVATQDAGESNDHFIYLASSLTTNQIAANWAKSGTIMAWSAFLADENDGAFNRWFGPSQEMLSSFPAYRSMTSGLNNNGTNANGVLEGSIDLPAHLGSFPAQIFLAGAPYATADGGALVASAQVPAGNGSASISSGEFLPLFTRDIALDLPVANAGADGAVEAGMWATVDGSASQNPSGLPFTYAWLHVTGPAGTLTGSNAVAASFVLASNVGAATSVVLRLTVNDTRFDATDDVSIAISPMVDTDGDGLSDGEETTGADNILTLPNPSGITTSPTVTDTDGDGLSDGDEAIAGTNPTSTGSVFVVASTVAVGSDAELAWPSVTGRTYNVLHASNLLSVFTAIATNIVATPPTNTFTAPRMWSPEFYVIEVIPPGLPD